MPEDKIYLTYENFRRLDVITRLAVGMPLTIFDVEEVRNEFPHAFSSDVDGYHGFSCSATIPVTKIPTGNGEYVTKEIKNLPHIANCIDLHDWAKDGSCCNRVWFDYSQVPRELVYDFLLHHEIAHIKHGDDALINALIKKGVFTVEDHNNNQGEAPHYRALTEYRADKYAWERIMPGCEMPAPKAPDGYESHFKAALRNIQENCRIHYDDLERVKLGKFPPISLDPCEYVPALHAEYGGRPPLLELKPAARERLRIAEVVRLASKSRKGKAALATVFLGGALMSYGILWLKLLACCVGAVLFSMSAKVIRMTALSPGRGERIAGDSRY